MGLQWRTRPFVTGGCGRTNTESQINNSTQVKFGDFVSLLLCTAHHAGVVVGLLSRVHQVELGQVGRQSPGAVNQHLLQTGQILGQ